MKKHWKEIIITVVSLIIIAFTFLHIFVNFRGRAILEKRLEEVFRRKVTIGILHTVFPLGVKISNIEAQGLFQIEEVFAQIGISGLFRNSLGLSSLLIKHPVITINKSTLQLMGDNTAVASGIKPASAKQKRSFFTFGFYVDRLSILEAKVNFIDTIKEKDVAIKVEQLNIKIDNLNFSPLGSHITFFDIKGKIPWGEGKEEGMIEAEGWVNLVKKDIQATLKIADIDGVYLYPYYAKWVDLEKARIQSAKLNFTSDIQGLNNNLVAECHLELTDIVRTPRPEGEGHEKAEAIANAVLDIFRSLSGGKIILDFTIKTKMDKPQFGFGTIKSAVEDKLASSRKGSIFTAQDFLMLPATLLKGTVKGAADITKTMIEGAVAVGKEIRKGADDIFGEEKQGGTPEETVPENVSQ
jgi:hypothetical protein